MPVNEMSKLDLSGPVRVPLGMKFRFDYQNEGALYGSLPRTSKEHFEYEFNSFNLSDHMTAEPEVIGRTSPFRSH